MTLSKICVNIAAEKKPTARRLRSGVDEIVPHIGRQNEDATRADWEDAVVALQLAGPGNDVLSLLCLICVPAEATTRLDLEDDRRRCVRAVSAVGDKRSLPTNRVVAIPVELRAGKVKRRYWVHTIPFTCRLASD